MMIPAPWKPLTRTLSRNSFFQAVCNGPKKAALAGGIALGLAVAGVRGMIGSTPAAAPACTIPGRSALEAPAGLGASDASRPASPAVMAMEQWLRSPVAPLSRNVFAVHPEYFRPAGAAAPAGTQDAGLWDVLAKSNNPPADEKIKRRQALDQAMHDAADLRLESTMMGSAPKALVNGKLVQEGDVVASFRVLKIEARGIIVEQKGIKLEIQFKSSAVE